MLWYGVQFHDGNVVQKGSPVEPVDGRPRCARSGINKDLVGAKGPFAAVLAAHPQGFICSKASGAKSEVQIVCLFDPSLTPVAKAVDHVPFPLSHTF